MFVRGYAHFLRTAERLQWDEMAIDLRTDTGAWPVLPERLRRGLGLSRGVELVLRDERWHVGFGARLLNELSGGAGVEAVTEEARDALDAWDQAVPAHIRETVLHLHRRRLAAAGVVEARAAA